MPIFEYECLICRNKFEILDNSYRTSDDGRHSCPKCLNKLLKKIPSCSSFILKGSTWAKDGYSSKKKEG